MQRDRRGRSRHLGLDVENAYIYRLVMLKYCLKKMFKIFSYNSIHMYFLAGIYKTFSHLKRRKKKKKNLQPIQPKPTEWELIIADRRGHYTCTRSTL